MDNKKGLIDSAVSWGISRYAHALNEWSNKVAKPERSSTLASLLGISRFTSTDTILNPADSDEKQRQALTVSWIYSDIVLIAREFSAAKLSVKKIEGEQSVDIPNHPFELLLSRANSEFGLTFIWQHTIQWLSLRGDAYWFLAPERDNPNAIAEIWPLQANRVAPVLKPNSTVFVEKYLYRTNTGTPILIDPRYVVHFMYPNPYSLWKGLSPLQAALLEMDTEIGSGTYQKDYYISGRGIPASVIMLNEDMSDRDFYSTVAQLREDFEQERKVVIARGGDLKVATVGLTQREMQLVDQRKFSRDGIDTIFLGVALHKDSTEAELRQLDKMFKEKTIHPLHILMAEQLNVQIMRRFYSDTEIVEFEDIRAQDKSLNVQERNVYWRAKTLNEARQDLGLPAYEDEEVGSLLVPLATDPAYIAMLKGISRTGKVPGDAGGLDVESRRREPSANASMSESDAPVNQMVDAAAGFKDLEIGGLDKIRPGVIIDGHSIAASAGIEEELKRWQKVALKEIKSERNPFLKAFVSEIIPKQLCLKIRGGLWESEKTEEAIKILFDIFKADLRGGGRGRKPKEIEAVNAYQRELEAEYDEWADETAIKIAEAEDDTGRRAVIAAAVLILLGLLQELGRRELPDAMFFAIGDHAPTPEMLLFMANAVAENDTYLKDSFVPDLQAKLGRALSDPDIIIAIGMGREQAIEAIRSVMATMSARVAQYAGWHWRMRQYTLGLLSESLSEKIRWILDPDETVRHCADCLEYGDTTYDSFTVMLSKSGGKYPGNAACRGNCRCRLEHA